MARIDLPVAVPVTATGQDSGSAASFSDLTPRELEVLRLLASGRSNREIGAQLFISPKTASVHVSHILTKLGLRTRVQATVVAYQLGLVDADPLASVCELVAVSEGTP